jgi:ubiquinone/menaquinone biosynthesis C-methylase UbiE
VPDPTEQSRENPSAYFVQDRSNQDEITRLMVQDKLITAGMGGVLPELDDPTSLRRMLDVGCGTGGWLMETAKTYPMIETLVGGDISSKMLAYTRQEAERLGLDKRVQFKTMDALRVLEFPASSFDLVNQRLANSWLRTWEWKKILLEYMRVCRPDGIIRITESNLIFESNSPALTKINRHHLLEAYYRSGRLFAPTSDGLTSELVHLMTQYGIQDVKSRVHTLVYRGGTEAGQYFYEDARLSFRLLLPFFEKWTRVPEDYAEICKQALKEIQHPDFVGTWTLVTAWGRRPRDGEPLFMRGLR